MHIWAGVLVSWKNANFARVYRKEEAVEIGVKKDQITRIEIEMLSKLLIQ